MENTKQTKSTQNTDSMFMRSRAAFLRDLPTLLANPKYDRWCAAYYGNERIGIAASSNELIKACQIRTLPFDDVFIGCIFPHGEEEEEIETGFFEFEDMELDEPSQGTSPIS